MFRFSKRSWNKLEHVRPELIAVATLALSRSEIDFAVISGVRTPEQQAEYIRTGASKLSNPYASRHVPDPKIGLGNAIDIMAYVGGEGRWDSGLYLQIGPAMKQAANDLGVPIEWGHDLWDGWDSGHFQLPTEYYL